MDQMESSEDELNVVIRNVISTFDTRCQLNLHIIGASGRNLIYNLKRGNITMKLRKPRITATMWPSGKILCRGATGEEEAKIGSRRIARCLQKMGFEVTFAAFRVVNVMAVCSMPFRVSLIDFTNKNRPIATYEPELYPGAMYTIKQPKATIKVFSTGKIILIVPRANTLVAAVQHVYPLLYECRRPK